MKLYQPWHALDSAELSFDLFLQPFAAPQRCSGHAGAFHVAPSQFIGVQFRRIAGKEMQCQHAVRGCNIRLHQRGLVRGKSVDHQMHRLRTTSHHPPQQDEGPPEKLSASVWRTRPPGTASPQHLSPPGTADIGIAVGAVVNRRKVAMHFDIESTDGYSRLPAPHRADRGGIPL
jgi:hypothetical protein